MVKKGKIMCIKYISFYIFLNFISDFYEKKNILWDKFR